MKIILTFIVLNLINISDASASKFSCDRKNPVFSVEVVAKKLNFNVRESIDLALTITNVGRDFIRLPNFVELESYWLRFEVINQKNERVKWLGPEVKIIENNSRVTLEPGYYWGRPYLGFEKLYDLSAVGKYRIRAVYGIGPDGKCPLGMGVSNSLNLIIN